MTKRNLFFFPAISILITSIQAVRLFFAQPAPYSLTGINAVIPGLIAFCMISYFAFIVREKYWRVGMTWGGFAFIARSCIIGYPEQKLVLVVLTLTLNLLSIAFLSASWRSLGADFTLGDRNQGGQGIIKKSVFVVAILIVIAGIFLFWGRG